MEKVKVLIMAREGQDLKKGYEQKSPKIMQTYTIKLT